MTADRGEIPVNFSNEKERNRMFSKILAATKFPSLLDEAVVTAVKLSEQNKAVLYILHVLDTITSETLDRIDDREKIIGKIKKTYQELLKPISGADIQVRTGLPWQEIIRSTREKQVDLILLGSAEETDEKRKVGSTIANILKSEPSPVMIVNRRVSAGMMDFKNILVGVDFSGSCACAVRFAGKFFEQYQSKIHLFHMLPVPPQPEFSVETYHRKKEDALQNLNEFGDTLLETVPFEKIVLGGNAPHREIIRYTEGHAIDLIVMGSHTKIDGGQWYVGSAVERVSKQSPCPVVVITDPCVIQRWEE